MEIKRDQRGIPFITAADEVELYLAQGYATAADRLWQMDFLRRTARGELAEVLGAVAVGSDKLHRIYGFRTVAEKQLAGASVQTREVLEAYARGVNAYINECGPKSLPLEFQILGYQPSEWTAIDSLALGKLFAENLSFTVEADILRALLSDLPPERFQALLPVNSPLDLIDDAAVHPLPSRKFSEPELAMLQGLLTSMRQHRAVTSGDNEVGSNSWVVSGERTVSGKPMLASDPHLQATSPSIWHIVHLNTNDLRVSGVAVPGVPGIMIGHNQWIAWGITNLCPDVQDLYFEQFDPKDAEVYKTPGGWQRAEVRNEVIAVRNTAYHSGNEPVNLAVKTTRHGPIICESSSIGLALRWTALDADVIDLETFLGLNRARNWDDFVTALSGYGGPPQNFTYADTAGHIGYYSAGRIPIRKSADGSVPHDGTSDEGDWVGFIPFQEMPHEFDPPSGFIVMANQRIVDQEYPHHLTHNWRVPYRARRIYERLEEQARLSVADFLAIQGDTYSYPDLIFAAEVVKLGERLQDAAAEWVELCEQLRDWDGFSQADSGVLPLVTEMRKQFRIRVLNGVLGTERAQLYEWRNESTFVDKLIVERPADWLPREFDSYESLLLVCYREAVAKLTKQLGQDKQQWTWGRMAQVKFPHQLERLGSTGARFATSSFPQETDGSMPTVNAGSRVSLRFVADLSDWDATRLCLPLGESGDPRSAHREDQLNEWRNVSPSTLPFSDDAIAKSMPDFRLVGS